MSAIIALDNLRARVAKIRRRIEWNLQNCHGQLQSMKPCCYLCGQPTVVQCVLCGSSVCLKRSCRHRWGSWIFGEDLCDFCGHGLVWTPEPSLQEWTFDYLTLNPDREQHVQPDLWEVAS